MTTIRIVCTFDAAETAGTLMRLLSAEQHDVVISKGRSSQADLPAARTAKEAVVLIWSKEARGAQYIRDWADAVAPGQLIEIACAPTWPRGPHRAPVIDFNSWRGERGGKAWGALKERLRQAASAWEPAKPPPMRAIAAAGMLGACAVTGAFVIAADEPALEPATEPSFGVASFAPLQLDEIGGIGGAIRAREPPSADELDHMPMPARLRAAPQYVHLREYVSEPLGEVADLRDATLLERLIALNPLTRDEGY